MSAPTCMDCKHRRSGISSAARFSKCVSPQLPVEVVEDPVTGRKILFSLEYCSVIRESSQKVMCGPEGKWFERKEPWWSKIIGTASK